MDNEEHKGNLQGAPSSSLVAHLSRAISEPEKIRELGLIEEVRIGFRFLKQGLREVDQICPGNDFYHLPVLLLSIGLERIMKCMICMNHKNKYGVFPTHKDKLWKSGSKGHDLNDLKKRILEFYVQLDGQRHADDYRFLFLDEKTNEFFNLLSEYGMSSRYYNLNELLLGSKNNDPMTAYDKFTSELALSVHGTKLFDLVGDPSKSEEAYFLMNKEFKSLVERLTRALARQFIHGVIQEQGRRFLSDLDPFYKIEDKDLGIRAY